MEQQREAAAAAASGEELNTREVNVLSSLRDLFALSIVEEVRARHRPCQEEEAIAIIAVKLSRKRAHACTLSVRCWLLFVTLLLCVRASQVTINRLSFPTGLGLCSRSCPCNDADASVRGITCRRSPPPAPLSAWSIV